MGRPRSNYICPKCGKQGYKEKNATRNGSCKNAKYRKYWRVVHYDSFIKKKIFCHVDYIIWEMENKERILEYKKKVEQMSSTEIQEEYLRIQKERQEMNNRIRLVKQIFKEVESKITAN